MNEDEDNDVDNYTCSTTLRTILSLLPLSETNFSPFIC